MLLFEATSDFSDALGEVDLLNRSAAKSDENPCMQEALNKATILLLMAKLESFIEHIMEEFCYRLSTLSLRCEQLPDYIRFHATHRLLNKDLLGKFERGNIDKVIPTMNSLALIWSEGCTPSEIKVNCSFNYGKHGEKAIRKLFQRLGIDDIFEICTIANDQETLTGMDSPRDSISADINALTGIRNYIIHNDGTPSLSNSQISEYKERIFKFAKMIDWQLHHAYKEIVMVENKDLPKE